MSTFKERLNSASSLHNSFVCVGLDPDPARMAVPDILEFNRTIIDATADVVCAFKPQLAFYEAFGIPGLQALEGTIAHIRRVTPHAIILGDAKRGDIGSTATAYAKAMFEVWGFDATTVNVYQGFDAVEPFLKYGDRGVFVLCRSSNPSARDIQDLPVEVGGTTMPVYRRVAERSEAWNSAGNVGLVIGATYPEELEELRKEHPTLPLLIPGVGAQGGDVVAATMYGLDKDGGGMLISSSRDILYASSDPKTYGDAARGAAIKLRDQINAAVQLWQASGGLTSEGGRPGV
ncbi:MAG: orotidine-5'-phosphate decarboxylase [Dehalococcoidia bacterium]|nr:orotidine-5'-phosphate decarboxylase [Dehalococcoidia bacterium]